MELYLSTHCQFTTICVYLCSDDVVVDVVCEHCTRAGQFTMICVYLCSDDVVVDVVCEHCTRWNCISLLTVSLR